MFGNARMWHICRADLPSQSKEGLRDPMCTVGGGAVGVRPPKFLRAQMMPQQAPDVMCGTTGFGFSLRVFIFALV